MAIGNAKYESGKLVGYDVTFEGCVLTTRERNMHDDSDFYAVVWDEKEQRLREVEYATTRFYTYDNYAKVDATEEVKQKANDWLVQYAYNSLKASDKVNSKRPAVGKRVRVVAGRKVEHGTEGVIFYAKEKNYDKYGRSWGRELRIGFKDDSGNVFWSYGKNVEVVNPDTYLTPDAELAHKAEQAKGYWHVPFAYGCGLYVM